MQEILFFSYKIEKVYTYFNRSHLGHNDTLENITSFKEKLELDKDSNIDTVIKRLQNIFTFCFLRSQ